MSVNISIILLITIALVALIDYIPRAINAAKKPISVQKAKREPAYWLMPTVYGDISYLKNLDFLRAHADHVLICTSRYETPEFYTKLEKICRDNGLRFACGDLPKVNGKPIKNAYTIYEGVFETSRELGIKPSTPCILIDADTYTDQNVADLAYTFRKHKLDIAALRCEVSNPQTTLEILQAYEYKLAMNNRRMDAWLTSGACNMAKTSVFKQVFARHSHFFAGGDIEIGKLAQIMGYRNGHIDFSFYTAVPNTFKDWFDQRIIWFAGGVRHHVVNIASFSWQHFFILLYNSLLIYLLLPLRWVELINYPLTFFLLIAVSYVYLLVSNVGRGWHKEYLLLPAYSFIQCMIILPIAFGRYCKYAWMQRSFGRLKYDMSHVKLPLRVSFALLNFASAALVLLIAGIFTVDRTEYWYKHGPLFHTIFSTIR